MNGRQFFDVKSHTLTLWRYGKVHMVDYQTTCDSHAYLKKWVMIRWPATWTAHLACWSSTCMSHALIFNFSYLICRWVRLVLPLTIIMHLLCVSFLWVGVWYKHDMMSYVTSTTHAVWSKRHHFCCVTWAYLVSRRHKTCWNTIWGYCSLCITYLACTLQFLHVPSCCHL